MLGVFCVDAAIPPGFDSNVHSISYCPALSAAGDRTFTPVFPVKNTEEAAGVLKQRNHKLFDLILMFLHYKGGFLINVRC